MFDAPTSPAIAGVQAVLAGGLLLLFGHLLVDAVTLGRLHFLSKLTLAFPALVAWSLVLMIAHIVSGGRVFSEPVAVRLVTLLGLVVVIGLRVYRLFKTKRPGGRRSYLWLLGAALSAGLAVMEWQVFRNFPLDVSGEAQMHAGWTMQLLSGESTPSATITGDVPNYYPWMFHAVAAFIADLVPGRNAWFAFGPLQVLQVTAVVTALFALGREVTGRLTGGLSASFFGALCGGFGFVALRSIDYATNARGPQSDGAMEYLGDLIVDRPYNTSFFNLPGPLPRDLALTLLAVGLFAVATGVMHKSRGWLALSGAIIGLVGLTASESFFVGLFAVVLISVSQSSVPRLRALGLVLGPLAVVYSLWLVPFLLSHFDLGGLVDITPIEPGVLPPWGFPAAWAPVIPFAVWGLILAVPRARSDVRPRVLLAILGAALLALAASFLVPDFLTDPLSEIEAPHGYWAFVYLALALVAACGFVEVLGRFLKKNAGGAALFLASVVALGLISPVVAGVARTRTDAANPLYKVVNSSLTGERATAVGLLAERGPRECVAAVPRELSRAAFALTGFRQVHWQGFVGTNRARIRWADIYERVVPESDRARDNEALVTGTTTQERWRSLIDKYGVDFVVVRSADADRETFSGYSSRPVRLPAPGYSVIDVGNC